LVFDISDLRYFPLRNASIGRGWVDITRECGR
jgi:hypothetical protein